MIFYDKVCYIKVIKIGKVLVSTVIKISIVEANHKRFLTNLSITLIVSK